MSPSPPALVEALNLGRANGPAAPPLLAPTCFSLFAGERVAISGSSGSGKSVFLRLLALLDPPSSGEIRWRGSPVTGQSIPHYRSRVCYLAQRPALVDGTVLENLQLPFTLKVLRHRTLNMGTVHDLVELAGKTRSFLDKLSTDLSGGEAQIAALIRVLLLEPQVILFDEPTSALDPDSAASVEGLVMHWFEAAVQSHAYAWVSHDQEQALRMSSRQLKMQQGVLQAENIE
ncbi:ATP-binding cassette domain-containing protein [Pseudomonas aeruginosa]|uniref:ABC transporter ATP-binding protein n=1 Tax=Pseudomonas TaxID=286 RepID=UPI000CD42C6F|nr:MULTISPECIES: ATP-binding cassette domain-containing protein [Pseudomonas]HDS1771304.1 ATP-binding cassette domain-containing protein [Pseudomonas putida]